MEVEIDHRKAEEISKIYIAVLKKVKEDYFINQGSKMPTEGAQAAAIIITAKKLYKIIED